MQVNDFSIDVYKFIIQHFIGFSNFSSRKILTMKKKFALLLLALSSLTVIADDTGEESQDSSWLLAPVIVIEDDQLRVEGPEADQLGAVYVNGTKMKVSKGIVNLSAVEEDVLEIKVTMSNGVILKQTYRRQ